MSAGEIRGPVKTQYGYHIIRLDEIQAGKTKTFEEARPELEPDLRKTRATDRFGEIQERLQTQAEAPGATLEGLAKEFQLQTGDVPQFLKGAGGAPLGAAPPLQELVFGDSPLAAGHLGGPVLLGDDRLVLVKVLDHQKPEPKPVAEVHDAIVAILKKEHGSDAALKAAQAAQAKLDGGASFDDVAKELGLTAEPARFVGRSDPAVPAAIRTLVFDVPRPAEKPVYRALKIDTGAALVAVTKSRVDTGDASKQMQAEIVKRELDRQGTADAVAYLEDVRRKADVRKNPKAFE
jgi:peptidyl-prolyl cis-trans isomerase D